MPTDEEQGRHRGECLFQGREITEVDPSNSFCNCEFSEGEIVWLGAFKMGMSQAEMMRVLGGKPPLSADQKMWLKIGLALGVSAGITAEDEWIKENLRGEG